MNLCCPHCGFSKEVAETAIPANTRQVRCPSCGQSFPFEKPQPGPEKTDAAASKAAGCYAGFWLRVVASLIDSIVVFFLQLFSGLILGISGSFFGGMSRSEGSVVILIWMFSSVLSVLYYVIFTGSCGQTLGKMALRIKVIAVDGSELGYGKAALREIIGKFLSGILLGIGYLMVAFDERKQGLHDKISGSCVIKL